MARKRNTDMMPGKAVIRHAGHDYEILFTMDAIDRICEAFSIEVDGIVGILQDTKAPDFRKRMLRIIAILIDSAADIHNEDYPGDDWPGADPDRLGRRMTPVQFAEAHGAVVDAYIKSFISDTAKTDEDDIGADPNPERAV